VSVVPKQGPHAMGAVPRLPNPLAAWPPTPEDFTFTAGDFIAMLWHGDVAKGIEVVTLCSPAEELGSAYVLETLVHEIELLRYQRHVHRMGDDLRRTLDSLRATQSQLLRFEELAALGIAVSGVAHEMNTPLGNCLLTVSTLSSVAAGMQRKQEEGWLRRADLEQLLSTSATAAQLLERNIEVAMRLVGDFKGLRAEHGANPPQAVSLSAFLGELPAFERQRARAGR
jgi:signal transduction histidine kinase